MKAVREWAMVMVVLIAVFIPSFTGGVAFHQNLPQREPAAIFGSLVPGVALTLLYFQRGRLGWLRGIVGGLFLGFSLTLALLHGWEIQAEAVIGAGAVLFMVSRFIVLFRTRRRFNKTMDTVNTALLDPTDGHSTTLFRDDGERLVIYPNRRRLLLQTALLALLFVVPGSVLAFVPIDNSF
jgi:hypothetical protein